MVNMRIEKKQYMPRYNAANSYEKHFALSNSNLKKTLGKVKEFLSPDMLATPVGKLALAEGPKPTIEQITVAYKLFGGTPNDAPVDKDVLEVRVKKDIEDFKKYLGSLEKKGVWQSLKKYAPRTAGLLATVGAQGYATWLVFANVGALLGLSGMGLIVGGMIATSLPGAVGAFLLGRSLYKAARGANKADQKAFKIAGAGERSINVRDAREKIVFDLCSDALKENEKDPEGLFISKYIIGKNKNWKEKLEAALKAARPPLTIVEKDKEIDVPPKSVDRPEVLTGELNSYTIEDHRSVVKYLSKALEDLNLDEGSFNAERTTVILNRLDEIAVRYPKLKESYVEPIQNKLFELEGSK